MLSYGVKDKNTMLFKTIFRINFGGNHLKIYFVASTIHRSSEVLMTWFAIALYREKYTQEKDSTANKQQLKKESISQVFHQRDLEASKSNQKKAISGKKIEKAT